jgi:hypothetical protein
MKFFPKIVSVRGAPPQLTDATSSDPRTRRSMAAAVMLTLPKMERRDRAMPIAIATLVSKCKLGGRARRLHQPGAGALCHHPIGQNIRRGSALIGHSARHPRGDSDRSAGQRSAPHNSPRHSLLCLARSSTPLYLAPPRFAVDRTDISPSIRRARRIAAGRADPR